MKKLFIALLAFVALAATNKTSAQDALASSKSYDLLKGYNDSVVATGTKYLTANLDGDLTSASLVVKLIRSAGNARCTLRLQVTNDKDGQWHYVTNGVSHLNGATTITDTMLNNSSAQYWPFDLTDYLGWSYIRVELKGMGTTGHVLPAGSYIRRKKRT